MNGLGLWIHRYKRTVGWVGISCPAVVLSTVVPVSIMISEFLVLSVVVLGDFWYVAPPVKGQTTYGGRGFTLFGGVPRTFTTIPGAQQVCFFPNTFVVVD